MEQHLEQKGICGRTGLMKLEHVSPTRANEEEEARSLLRGQSIGLAVGNPLLLAAMNLLEFFRGKVLWAVTTEKEALQEMAIKAPDLVILTDEMEQGYGPSLIKELKSISPETHTLIFLAKETAAVVEECLEAGAEGICFNSNVSDGDGDFVKALRSIAKHGVYYPEEVKKKAGYVGANPFALVLPNDITEREKEVLVGLTEGLSNKELAESMFLSVETIKSHLKSLTGKLGVKDRTGAAIFGVKAGVGRG